MEFLLNPLIKKEEWNRFVLENGWSFLQSYEWGNFQQQSGNDVTRAVVKDGGRIVLAAQILRYSLPLGKSYIYIPYGPVFASGGVSQRAAFDFFIAELKKMANRASRIIFLKVEMDREWGLPHTKSDIGLTYHQYSEAEPFRSEADMYQKASTDFVWGEIDPIAAGFRKSDKDIQARETMIMDLTPSEGDILGGMKQKARYNIKVAQKHGVKIVSLDSAQMDPQIFVSLLEETAKRNGFRTHGRKYYLDMMELFLGKTASPDANAFAQKLYFAYYKEEIAAAALIGFFGKRATYLHGASAARHKNVMAPYLLHWEIIREIKRLGFSEYDFWGAVTARTEKSQIKKWSGFSRFKEGFGGRIAEYPGAYDLVFNKLWYNGYRIIRKIHNVL